MILAALRDKLPRAVFFTTDLDSRLSDPTALGDTRNVIVGSSYGLRLRNNLQSGRAGFRDCYQTSTYTAVLLALGQISSTEIIPPGGRLFEIGRTGAWDLSPAVVVPKVSSRPVAAATTQTTRELTRPASAPQRTPLASTSAPATTSTTRAFVAAADDDDVSSDGIHPSPSAELGGLPQSYLAISGGLLLLAIAGGMVLLHMRMPWVRVRRLILSPFFAIAIAVPLILALLIFLCGRDARANEPLVFTEGISAWPTEGIRMLAVWLGIMLLVKSCADLRENRCEIARKYKLEPALAAPPAHLMLPADAPAPAELVAPPVPMDAPAPPQGPAPADVEVPAAADAPAPADVDGAPPADAAAPAADQFKLWHSAGLWTLLHSRPVDVPSLWKQYVEWGSGERRFARVAWMAAAYIAFATFLFVLLPRPHIPARGDWARNTDTAAWILAAFVQLVLTFFVVDATRLCERLISNLTLGGTSHWPPELQWDYRACRGGRSR
jgi:hypothetical protein